MPVLSRRRQLRTVTIPPEMKRPEAELLFKVRLEMLTVPALTKKMPPLLLTRVTTILLLAASIARFFPIANWGAEVSVIVQLFVAAS